MVNPPTVIVRMADAGHVFTSWRWLADTHSGGVSVAPEDQVAAALAALAAGLPDLADPNGVRRALSTGALASFDAENELAQQLSRTFLPYGLAVQLHDLMTHGIRPHIRLQPSPRTAQVPWELIAPDAEVRLLDIADLSMLAPLSVVQAAGRNASVWESVRHLPVVALLDPRVPGFRADSALGSVLGRPDAAMPAARMVARHADRLRPAVVDPVDAFRRDDVDRAWLGEQLRAGASRLLYVGHVTAAAPESGESESAELHLACTADTVGFAAPMRTHRPFAAKDLLLGTHMLVDDPVAGQQQWPVPSRVALIACESGGDLRFSESLGLVTAMIQNGAELVTASRWPLPTDFAFSQFAGAAPETRPLQDAVCEIDAAHEQDDPVRALGEWQRARLAAWRAERTAAYSPVLWVAFATVSTV
ncbi:CHAT domain-containing protein [Antrihabitans sp. YC2-6]|uniref:CHAT domain-containing protein n=1 Tax=Antrihabitans sp. YC2-6 TaxID=2799498 RepID=UPI0018F3D9E2|nr:CHAT domain-containing protein [Antrihabitans sp. YC2-6]MBJ8346583.1 CHAT domain-containing protein [Antrihabitans sp. YC2-6]